MTTVVARAKVNLFLRVLARRPDGFHEIESVFHSIDLADIIELSPAPATSVEMSFTGVPVLDLDPKDNLAAKAASAVLGDTGVAITLEKRIPFGAGLAGGSADAAGVLRGLKAMDLISLTEDELLEVAAALGSDVPYCMTGGPALVTGRGEQVRPLRAAESLWLVLGISHRPLSTAEIYAACEPTSEGPSSGSMTLALEAGDITGVAAALHNDLEGPAFSLRPELEAAKVAMLDAGALGAVMSGSGPTIVGVAATESEAVGIAEKVVLAFDRVEVTRSMPRSFELGQQEG